MLDFWKLKAQDAPIEKQETAFLEPIAPIEMPEPVNAPNFDNLNCHGCGVDLQYTSFDQIGYIPKNKVSEHFKKQEELKDF